MTDVTAKMLGEWHEDDGPVLWWNFPVEEPPYAGTPLDEDFPAYKTHWTRFDIPQFMTTTSAALFEELGSSPEEAESMERGLNAVIRREEIRQNNTEIEDGGGNADKR